MQGEQAPGRSTQGPNRPLPDIAEGAHDHDVPKSAEVGQGVCGSFPVSRRCTVPIRSRADALKLNGVGEVIADFIQEVLEDNNLLDVTPGTATRTRVMYRFL